VADWYSPPRFADQQTDQLSYRKTGTGRWFLDHADYHHWRDHANATLLCPGIPGSGKSVMAAIIVDDLRAHFEQKKDVVTVYFYCSFNRQSEQNLGQMLASLTRQMFQEQDDVPKAIEDIYLKHRDRGTRPTVDQLKDLLRLLVQDYARVFIVIDALDECENKAGSRDQLLDELFGLQAQKAKNVNVLVTTRCIPEITTRFTTCPEIEIQASKEDIERYMDSCMSILPLFVRQSIKLQNVIKKGITDAAKGMLVKNNPYSRRQRVVLTIMQLPVSSAAIRFVARQD
jgi:NACHT domain